jgi:1-acyl-sn-glycerol-3-phosphate acyltransferase
VSRPPPALRTPQQLLENRPAPRARFSALDVGQPLGQMLFYRASYWIALLLFTLLYRVRFFSPGHIPPDGPALIVVNHQSYIDPPLVGVAVRHRNFPTIARKGLFKVPVLSLIIKGLGAIPIDDEGSDTAAIRASLAQLAKGRLLAIFPEGTRSPDGQLRDFKRGTWLLLSRSKVPVIPCAVEGCHDVFPRGQSFPTLLGKQLMVRFGPPVSFEELRPLGPDSALRELEAQVEVLRADLRQRIDAGR